MAGQIFKLGALFSALLFFSACQTAPPPAPAVQDPLARVSRIDPAAHAGFAVSHDDERLVFAAQNIFAIPVDGGDADALTLTASDTMRVVSAFPNDDRLLISDRNHLYARSVDGELRDLGIMRFLSWRADGRAFFAASGDRNAETLHEFDAETYQRRSPSSGGGQIGAVSRDGRWLAILSQDGGIGLVDLTSADPAPRRIVSNAVSVFEFSPNGAGLIYGVTSRYNFTEAWRYDLASGESTPVMQAQANVLALWSSASGRYRVFETGAEDQVTDVIVINQTNDRGVPISANARNVRFDRDETRIFYSRADDDWPYDIFVSDITGEHTTRLVHAPNAR